MRAALLELECPYNLEITLPLHDAVLARLLDESTGRCVAVMELSTVDMILLEEKHIIEIATHLRAKVSKK